MSRAKSARQPTTAPKVLRPFRPPRFPSVYLHGKAILVWKVLLYTLPIDALLLSTTIRVPRAPLTTAVVAAALLAFLFGFRERIFSSLSWLRSARKSLLSTYAKVGAILCVVLIVVELLVRFSKFGMYAPAAVLVIAIPAIFAVRKGLRETKQRNDALERDRVLWVNQINIQNFFLAITPMFAARFISFAGTLISLGEPNPLIGYSVSTILSLFLLLGAYPLKEHFVVACSGCGHWTSRALQNLGFCPLCAVEKFEVVENSAAE